MLKLSVCVPTYNQSNYLAECLNSLLSQTIMPFEIIVSENHSTDNTNSILDKYSTKVKVVRPPRHLSMIENYQFCGEHTKGEWVIFMTSDDIAEHNYVYDILEGIKKNPDSILIRGWHKEIKSNGSFLRNVPAIKLPKISKEKVAFIEQFDGPKCFFEATAFRKSAWELAGGFNTKLKLYGDWGMWISLSNFGSFARIDQYLTQYRIWERYDRGINRIRPHLEDSTIIFKEMIFPKAKEYGPKIEMLARKKGKSFGYETLTWIHENADTELINKNNEIIQEFCDVLNINKEGMKILSNKFIIKKSFTLKKFIKSNIKKRLVKYFY